MRTYVERPVHASLAERVVCTWVDPATAWRPPVLPDGCIDIVWDGACVQVVGPDTGPSPIVSQATFVGIRFRPGAAPGFLGVAASELVDRTVSLADVWGRSAGELAERLAETPASAPRVLETALLVRANTAPGCDPLVAELLRQLSGHHAHVPSLPELTRRLDVSERTLRRRCANAIGYGPKTLARILRFRHALTLLRSKVSFAQAAQLAGYGDQAHLTHECQRLAGDAPGHLARLPQLVISSNGSA